MAKVPWDTVVCRCGHPFEPDRPSPNRMTETSHTEEERAYESYLEARLQQALDYLRTVREECGLDKWTPEQDQEVQQALQALQRARTELNAHRRQAAEEKRAAALAPAPRLQRAVAAAPDARGERPLDKGRMAAMSAVTEKTAPRKPAVPRVNIGAPLATPAARVSPPRDAGNSSPARRSGEPAPTPSAGVRADTQPAAKTPRASVSPRPAGAAPANNPARTMPGIGGFSAVEIDTSVSPVIKQPDRAPLAAPAGAKHAAGQALAAAPSKNFRLRQSNRVEHLFVGGAEPAPTAAKVPDMPSVQGFSPAAGDTFRTAQATKAKRARPNPDNSHQCPHCSATLPAQTGRCGCGHDVAKTSLFPEFELPAEEYAITEVFGGFPRRT